MQGFVSALNKGNKAKPNSEVLQTMMIAN